MKQILFVDDDPLVLRIYKEALSKQGYYVEPAHDGLSATNFLIKRRPDLLVLDLMMPKLGGVDVLHFVRSQPELKQLPVIVLSNSYMNGLAQDAVAAGAQRALLKVRCTPPILLGVIRELLEGAPPSQTNDAQAAALPAAGSKVLQEAHPPQSAPVEPSHTPRSVATKSKSSGGEPAQNDTEFISQAREHFLANASSTCSTLRTLLQNYARAKNEHDRETQLNNLYRKVHFITAGAGLAECFPIARMAAVFEAMLFELTNKPALSSSSLIRTMAMTVDVFGRLFQQACGCSHDTPPVAEILVVDDDALSNRLVIGALRNAQLQARSTEDPFIALQWLRDRKYNLILLDIEMPGMDGFELCKRLRRLPGYQDTPVIYVTGHSDFESRAKSALSGGDDLIGKPVFPMELAVKAMAHLLSSPPPAT